MAHDSGAKVGRDDQETGGTEEECRRSTERAEAADGKILELEEELSNVGENMKQLEISAEKAQAREEKLKEQDQRPYLEDVQGCRS